MQLYPPAGEFVLPKDKTTAPFVFITGGVGITPAIAMLEEALAKVTSRPITFIHCAKCSDVQPFNAKVAELAAFHQNINHYSFYSQEHHLSTSNRVHIDLKTLANWIPENQRSESEVFFIGPKNFMANVRTMVLALGIAEDHLHWEFFGPRSDLENA